MKKNKKLISLILIALVMVFSITACTNSSLEKPIETTESNTTITSVKVENQTPEKTLSKEQTSIKEEHITTPVTETNTVLKTVKGTTVHLTYQTTEQTTKAKPAETINAETTTEEPTTLAKVEIPITYHPEDDIYRLHDMVNEYRKTKGLASLELDLELCQLAYKRAVEQELSEGHQRPDGSRFYTVFEEFGYKRVGCGENIALVWNTPAESSLNGWLNSPPHNEGMLEVKWVKTGLALYQNEDGRYNVVQLFAY